MKKIFTIIALLALTMTAGAKDFTDQLVISLGIGEPTITEATISVEDVEGSDGLYNITLKDFSFGETMKLGDIKIENVKGNDEEQSGYTWFEETKTSITVNIGIPMSAEVTINEGSYMKGDKLYMNMTISAMGMNISAVFGTAESQTKSYTDNLVVTAMGSTMPAQQATIEVTKQSNGKYTLALKNFELTGVMAVGTVEMTDVDAVEEDGVVKLSTKQTVTIKDGDDPEVNWALEGVPVDVDMTGELTDDKLKADINILYTLSPEFSMDINVKFGYESTGITAPVTNSGVEAIYDINGNKLNDMKKGLNILKKADGTTVKVIKK